MTSNHRKLPVRFSVVWIENECPLEHVFRFQVGLARYAEEVARLHAEIISLQVSRMLGLHDHRHIDLQMAGNGIHDLLGDFVLHLKDIDNILVEAFGPYVIPAASRVDKLRVDAQTSGRSARAAFKDVLHAKFLRDLPYVDGLALVGEGRIAGDHEEVPERRQLRDDVLGDAVDKVLLPASPLMLVKGRTAIDGLVRSATAAGAAGRVEAARR